MDMLWIFGPGNLNRRTPSLLWLPFSAAGTATEKKAAEGLAMFEREGVVLTYCYGLSHGLGR